jgi:hypothetical protein
VDTTAHAISLLALVVSAGSFAVAAYTRWQQHIVDRKSYLVLSLTLERTVGNYMIAHTSLENRLTVHKKIAAARLVICAQQEDPVDAINRLLTADKRLDARMDDPRRIVEVDLLETLRDDKSIFMPLWYYTHENLTVGDETLTYDALIDLSQLEAEATYSARLYLVSEDRYHRIVHAAFVNHRS